MQEINCLFCKIVEGLIPANKIYEDDEFLSFRDINPQAPFHILVIPKSHIKDVGEADNALLLGKLVQTAASIAAKEGIHNGFRLVVNTGEDGGQTVFHLHLHILGGRKLSWPPG